MFQLVSSQKGFLNPAMADVHRAEKQVCVAMIAYEWAEDLAIWCRVMQAIVASAEDGDWKGECIALDGKEELYGVLFTTQKLADAVYERLTSELEWG